MELTVARGRVLVVDGEPDVVETMRDIVQALGYEASSASSGEAAIMMMATIQPHVILLDLLMPGISGLEALIYFREHHPAVPVIIITVDVDHEPAPRARAARALRRRREAVRHGAVGSAARPGNGAGALADQRRANLRRA